ncbi:PREDICTED: glutamate receptor 2.8-like [Erythranthe guttata]|uniref:glutamate receptor 2.8-like n=1 Tax=Erythranthe guttata TaxID=4155 RepID=UPI00064DE6A6|nr:PREDICTED: glutamate receptor 2.8-like [Erythranthe guttata]|eukprot:XP_012853996.1 PREDICTED: glutamate receptor 2.8-like [Erythranthe guttata]
MLTVQKLQPAVTDVNVLIQNKEYVGYMEGSFLFGFLKRLNFDESRLRPFNSAEEMDKLLSKGSRNGGIAAAFQEIPYIKLFLGKYCSKYVMVGPTYKADGFGFVCDPTLLSIIFLFIVLKSHFFSLQVFPTGSPLVLDVSRAILNVTEGQKMVEIERKWFGDSTKCSDSNTQLSSKSIGLESFAVLFSVVGIVGVIAFADYMIKFQHENRSVIVEPAGTRSTRWSKIVKWLKIFLSKKTDDGRKSPLNSPSVSTTTDRSQDSVSDSTSAFENDTTSQQGESSHITSMGIEPVDRNETSAQH